MSLVLIIVFFVWWYKSEILVDNSGTTQILGEEKLGSPISGIACQNYNRRPIAVMLSSDPITRPLSGISEADIVFEMPVTPSGVTRTMAVYQCESPKEIGSIRSAREDFIPLAASLGAIYAHWGGEREALEQLGGHIVDNIDAMKYEGTYFYRKKGLKQPHNGFASFDKLWEATLDLKYGIENGFLGYSQQNKKPIKNIANIVNRIEINYPPPFNVVWNYDNEKNIYTRSRGGKSEIDRNNNSAVETETVVVMETDSVFISKDYMNVRVVGEGNAVIYQNGMKTSGKWKKDPAQLDSKLFFYYSDGREIEFVPGKIWIEIVTE